MKTNDKWQLSGIVIRGHGVNRLIVFMLALLILLLIPTLSMADTYNLDVGDKQYLYSNKNYLPSGAAVSSYVWECKEPNFVRIISGSTSSSCQIEVVGYFSGPIAVTCTIYYTQLRDGYMYSGYCMGASHTIRINQSSSEDPEDPGTGYTITLDPQGGTVYPSYVKRNSGETYGDLPTPTRDGYIFDYWYYEVSSYENAIIGPSTRIQKNADHTLYAEWTPATYTIKFNGNGSTGGSMSSMTCSTNTSYSLSANRFTYTGRVFQCWNTQSNGLGVSYSDGQSVNNLAGAGGSITLYAIWKSADKQIPQCSLTLGTSSYTYDGSEKKPAVTVRDGTQKLVQGTDFTLTYQNNINAGTASVTITGIGSYSSSKTINYTIKKASQTVSASISEDYIIPGAQCAIQASGIGALSFLSDNTDIATVDANGTITGVGEGTVNITVTAAGNTNYNSASVVISIAITAFGPEVCGPNINWSISNGVLTLSGSGSMFNWPGFYADNAPWYDRRSEITSVVLSDQITNIGSNAFKNCSRLTRVNIPNSVTNIGQYSFSGCSGLTSMTLPFVGGSRTATGSDGIFGYIFGTNPADGLISVKQYYSDGNTVRYIPSGLKTVVITDVTQLSYGAFYNCSMLTSITIPNNLTNIGKYAFCNCSGLTSISIPNSITTIEGFIFYGCSGLTSVMIPSSVTKIEEYSFSHCSGLTNITIPDSVTSMNVGVFSDCTGLTNVTLPNSLSTINEYMFSRCSKLTSITIPSSVTSIGESTFSGCSGLTCITIPNSVTSIKRRAFSGCSGLASITIPNSVTSIGESTFSGCSGLTNMTLPFVGRNRTATGIEGLFGYIFGTDSADGLTANKQYYAFNSITSRYLPTNLKKVVITSATQLSYGAFSGCVMLTSVSIPSSVTIIGECAFRNCNRLTTLTLPFVGKSRTSTGIEGLFGYVFGTSSASTIFFKKVSQSYDSGSTTRYIPSSLLTVIITDATQLNYGAFYDCTMLSNVTIPNTMASIGNYAFYNCHLNIQAPSSISTSLVQQYGGTLTWVYYDIQSLESAVIDSIPDQFYTGSVVMPMLTVTCNGVSLTEGADYTASFTDNQNVGTAGVIISGFGKYTGTASASFNIIPHPLEAAIITGISDIQNADLPMALNPTVTLNGLQLTLNTDYTTSYQTDINGNAAIIITGCGNYSGTAQKSYRLVYTSALILPKAVTKIYSDAFANSNCRYVVIPDGCKSIGDRAFANCENLCRVWIPASVKTISADAFSGCSSGLVITAPLNSTAHQFAVSNGYLYEQAIE